MDEKRIAQMMKSLNLTEQEAIELLQEDEEIDKMSMKDVDNDLTAEQRKAIKQVKGGARAVDAFGKKRTVERKENPIKKSIIAELHKFLSENSENPIKNCEISNKERQIAFECGGNRYELTLVQKRPPKK